MYRNLLRMCMVASMKQNPIVLHTIVDKYID